MYLEKGKIMKNRREKNKPKETQSNTVKENTSKFDIEPSQNHSNQMKDSMNQCKTTRATHYIGPTYLNNRLL